MINVATPPYKPGVLRDGAGELGKLAALVCMSSNQFNFSLPSNRALRGQLGAWISPRVQDGNLVDMGRRRLSSPVSTSTSSFSCRLSYTGNSGYYSRAVAVVCMSMPQLWPLTLGTQSIRRPCWYVKYLGLSLGIPTEFDRRLTHLSHPSAP